MIDLNKFKSVFAINSNDPQKNRKKQYVVIGTIAVLVTGIGVAMLIGDSGEPKKEVSLPKNAPVKLIDDSQAAKTQWLASVAPMVDQSLKEKEETKKALSDTNLKIDEISKQLKQLSENPQQMQQDKGAEVAKSLNFKPGYVPEIQQQTPPALPPKPPVVQQKDLPQTLGFDEVDTKKTDTKELNRPYIPTGAFTRAVILQGINAPTMSKAKTSPLPVLLRLTDLSVIPNKKKLDLKECFVLAEGYGDLASERVHMRTTTLSCVTSSNKFIDMDLKGQIIDNRDGVLGVAGRVVSKQGALLGRTIIAGFLQGVGSAFGNSGQTILSSPLGTTTSQPTDPSTIARAGAYQGASKAAEKLADFYIKMADSIEPVIEVPGGLSVTVVVSKGSTIDEISTKKTLSEKQSDKDKEKEEKKQ